MNKENNGWINIKEKLPKTQERVLVYLPKNPIGHKVKICARLSAFEWVLNDNFNICYDATQISHWQPLPQPPKPNSKGK